LDDPYSHLVAQVIADFAARYDIEIVPHLVRASGGRNQPEAEKLAIWARRDCGLIAPHYGLSFPENAGTMPEPELQKFSLACLHRSSSARLRMSVPCSGPKTLQAIYRLPH
jgi:hypothetical protein